MYMSESWSWSWNEPYLKYSPGPLRVHEHRVEGVIEEEDIPMLLGFKYWLLPSPQLLNHESRELKSKMSIHVAEPYSKRGEG